MCQGMQLGGRALGWAGRATAPGQDARAEILLGEMAYFFFPQASSTESLFVSITEPRGYPILLQ